MDAVKIFNGELCSLYELKPPITKAKMSQITKTAIKAIKFYKHIVQSVEKFIQKCRPEYKVPGLYIVDSIIRQSRKQFGPEKDMFALRFSKNIVIMFNNLFECPDEEIAKMIRVLNLWQKNGVYGPEIIQPLLDLAADPHNEILFELVQQKVELVTGMTPSMPLKSDQKPHALTADALQLGFVAKNCDQSATSTANNPDMTHILTQIMQTLTCPPIIPPMPGVIGSQNQQLHMMQQALMHHATSAASTPANIIPSVSNQMSFNPATFAEQNMVQYDGTNLLTQLQVITQQLLASSNSIVQKSANNASTSSPNDTNTDLDASNSEDRRISSLDRRLDAIKAGRESDFCYDDEDDADAESALLDATKNEEFEMESSIDHRLTVTVKNSSLSHISDNPSSSHRSSSRYTLPHSSRHDNFTKSAILNPSYNDASPISGCSETTEEDMRYEAEEGEVIERNDYYNSYSSDENHHGYDKSNKNKINRGPSRDDYTQSPEYFWAEKEVEKIDARLVEKRKRKYSGKDLDSETPKNIKKKVTEEQYYDRSYKKSKVDNKPSSNLTKDTRQENSKKDNYYNGKSHKSRSRSYSDGSTSDPMYDPFKHKEIRSVVSKPDKKNIIGNDHSNVNKASNCKYSDSNEKISGKENSKYDKDLNNVNDTRNKEVIDSKLKSVCSKIFDEKLDRYLKVDKPSKDDDFKLKLKTSKELKPSNDTKNKESSHKLVVISSKDIKSSSSTAEKSKSSSSIAEKIIKTSDSIKSTSKVDKISSLTTNKSDNDVKNSSNLTRNSSNDLRNSNNDAMNSCNDVRNSNKDARNSSIDVRNSNNDARNSRERSRSNENIKTDQKKRNYRTNAKLRRKSPVIVIDASPQHSDDSSSSVELVTNPISVSKQIRNPNLPPLKPQHISICSTTLWIGRINKVVSEEEIKSALSKFTISSINIVPPRGCAFVTFSSRADACQALEFLKDAALLGSNSLKVAWAAGNGIKISEFFCHVEHGVTYIPWERLKNLKLRDLLEGGVLDEITLPPGYNIDELEVSKENKKTPSMDFQEAVLDIPIPVIPSAALPIIPIPSLSFASLPLISSPLATISVETLPITTISLATSSEAALLTDPLPIGIPPPILPPPNFAFFSMNQAIPPPPIPPTLMKPSFIPPALIFPGAPPPLLRSKINISIRKPIVKQSVPFRNKYAIYDNLEKDTDGNALIDNQIESQNNIVKEDNKTATENLNVIEMVLKNRTDSEVTDMEICDQINEDKTVNTLDASNTNFVASDSASSDIIHTPSSSQYHQTQINSVIERIIETNNRFIDVINKSVDEEEDEGNMDGMYSPSDCYRDVPPVAVSFGRPPPSVSSTNVCYNSSMTRLSIETINCSLNNSYSVQSATNYNYPQIIKNDSLNLQWQSNNRNAPLQFNQRLNNCSTKNVPLFPNLPPPIFPVRNVFNENNTFNNIQPMFNKAPQPFTSSDHFSMPNNSSINSDSQNYKNLNINHNFSSCNNPPILYDFNVINNLPNINNSNVKSDYPINTISNNLNFASSNSFINESGSKGLLPDFSSGNIHNVTDDLHKLFPPPSISLYNEHGKMRGFPPISGSFNNQQNTISNYNKLTLANAISSYASKTFTSSISQQVFMNAQNPFIMAPPNSSLFNSPSTSLCINSIQNNKSDLNKSSSRDTKSRNFLNSVTHVSDSSQLESLINSISESNQLIRNALTDELPRIHNLTRNITPNKIDISITSKSSQQINSFVNQSANMNIRLPSQIFNQPKVLLNSSVHDPQKMNINPTLRPRNIDISRPPPLLLNPGTENIMRTLNPIVSTINAQILRPPPTLLLNPPLLNMNTQHENNLPNCSRPLLMNPTFKPYNPLTSTNFLDQKLSHNDPNRMQLPTGVKASVSFAQFNPNQPPPQIPTVNNAVSCRILVNTPPQNIIRMAVDGNSINIENIRLMAPPRLPNPPVKSSNILPAKMKQPGNAEDGLLGEFDPTMHGDKKKTCLLNAEPPKVPLITTPLIRETLPLRSTAFDGDNILGPAKSIQEGPLRPNTFEGVNFQGPPKLIHDGPNQHTLRLGPPPSAKNLDSFSRLPPPPHIPSISTIIRRPLLRDGQPSVMLRPGPLEMMRRPGPGPVDMRMMMMRRAPPPFSRRSIR